MKIKLCVVINDNADTDLMVDNQCLDVDYIGLVVRERGFLSWTKGLNQVRTSAHDKRAL